MMDVNSPNSKPWNTSLDNFSCQKYFHLEKKEENEDHSGRGGVGSAGLPVGLDAGNEVVDAEEEAVVREGPDVEGEEDKELLVSLSHTVIDPGTVVVHLLNTPGNKYSE